MNRSGLVENLKKENETKEEKLLQFVSFMVGEEEYATDILKVYEITSYKKLTKVPSMPPFVKGVLSIKDIIVPVIDLREKFSVPDPANTKFTIIMIVDVSGRVTGVVVDRMKDIIKVKASDIQPPPRFSTGIKTSFIRGMIKKGKEDFTIVLDMAKILSDYELNIMDTL
ncbi:MAG TPA: chemotaxis protein CheW [bacterium]|jgi:purine-binding chemotaxis protein CheW|nr:chemotaxis protein CheW [bacterium]